MLAGDILSLAADGAITRRKVSAVAAVVRPQARGGAVIGVEHGFALEDPDGTMTALEEIWTDGRVRMNEGGCDPDGRFYCGSMAYDHATGAAALYRLDPDGSVRAVLDNVTISNGLDWSPDGSLAYDNDTANHRIDVFDYDLPFGLTGRRPFVHLPEAAGSPDGLTVDSDGAVWVALYGGGAVRRYTPDGELDEVIEVAARKVTACTLGGPSWTGSTSPRPAKVLNRMMIRWQDRCSGSTSRSAACRCGNSPGSSAGRNRSGIRRRS